MTQENNTIIIDGNSLTLKQIIRVAKKANKVKIKLSVIEKLTYLRKHIDIILTNKKPYYGINTGFGGLSEINISSNQINKLQLNLIYSHAVGIGSSFSYEEARALMLLRLNSLAKGFSGCRPVIIQHIAILLNNGCAPLVPKKGSVGASGDLAPLAHLSLLLIGQGNALINGKKSTAQSALKKSKLKPIILEAKEGLSLINGTQAMCTLACFALNDALNLCKLANIIGACSVEALMASTTPFIKKIHELRPYKGQKIAALQLRKMLKNRNNNDHKKKHNYNTQDAYSLRCMPQVHGAVIDAISHINTQINIEINSATDNPLIFINNSTKQAEIISGGNFHGQPLAFILDYLGIVISALANISERRFENLLNPTLSCGLPAFLIKSSGLNSGFMMLQVSAAALVNENKILSHPASSDSIPTSANKEDFVSMGMTSANKICTILDNTYNVLSLELMGACQALDLRNNLQIAPQVKTIWKKVRQTIPFADKDRLFKNDMINIYNLCKSEQLQTIVNI